MSPSGLKAAVEAKALSADSIRCLAYSLAGRNGVRSDASARRAGESVEVAKTLVKSGGNVSASLFVEVRVICHQSRLNRKWLKYQRNA